MNRQRRSAEKVLSSPARGKAPQEPANLTGALNLCRLGSGKSQTPKLQIPNKLQIPILSRPREVRRVSVGILPGLLWRLELWRLGFAGLWRPPSANFDLCPPFFTETVTRILRLSVLTSPFHMRSLSRCRA